MTTPQPRFRELAIPTRDGVDLATDVYLPESDEPAPVIFVRTPYGRRRLWLMRFARQLNRAGFAVLSQDFRGRYKSSGTFFSVSGEQEGQDGFDTLCWLRCQKWCDGTVGLYGISLSSYSLLLLATMPPPDGINIRTMVNLMGVVDLHSLFYHQGALYLHWALPWSVMMHERWSAQLSGWQRLPWEELFRHRPLAEAAAKAGGAVEFWTELAAENPLYGDRWLPFDLRDRLRDLELPTLHLTGWYDHCLGQTLAGHDAMTQQRCPDSNQHLLVGPWDHQTLFISLLGEKKQLTRLGEQAPLHLGEVVLDWFKQWLGGGWDEPIPKNLLFVMGRDEWMTTKNFPLDAAVTEDWYLNSASTTESTDGQLVAEPAATLGENRFIYDPEDPVMTVGGAVWPFPQAGLMPGPAEQNVIEERPDVLVYMTAPLAEERVVIGGLEVELWAASSAVDTDFTARLVDVDNEGRTRHVQDGIVRARFRRSSVEECFLDPGCPERFQIFLYATAHCFRRGHRIRLEISSSNFPKYDRNPNTRDPAPWSRTSVPARQVVFHGGERPSRLRLPVVPRRVYEAARQSLPAAWKIESPSNG